MKRSVALPELLCPAGNEEALFAAIQAGADAVYLGVCEGESNARIFAENFSREQLLRDIPLAHAHGVKIYVTLNTLTYEKECASALSLAEFLYQAGVDALIVADLGLASLIKKRLPHLALHASTQAFAHSTATANALCDAGFSRVVAARELPFSQIRSLVENGKPEIEIFLHGALCVSYSGQCLFSSLVGGRSGNRGACAQPCRLPYNEGYPLSLKDLSLAKHIPALIESGVSSLKIEGRMKSASYVYGVTKIFRTLLDEGRAATDAEMVTLENIFSRSGFTDGYFRDDHAKMSGVRRAEDKEASRAEATAVPPLSPLPLKAAVILKAGEPLHLTFSFAPVGSQQSLSFSAQAEGPLPQKAENAALTAEMLKERIGKLGGTGFYLADCQITMEDGLFLPVGTINAVKREALARLLSLLRGNTVTVETAPVFDQGEGTPLREQPLHTALFYRPDVFLQVDTEGFDICFLPFSALENTPALSKMPNGVALPPVLFDREEKAVLAKLRALREKGVTYALVSSFGQAAFARSLGYIPFGDFRMNIANRAGAALCQKNGLCGFLASCECTPKAARALGGSVIVYGRIPLMLTERCFIKESIGCQQCEKAVLRDRKGISFPVIREYPHRCLVLNSLPTYLGDTKDMDIPLSTHVIFTTETPSEAEKVLVAIKKRAPLPFKVRRSYK